MKILLPTFQHQYPIAEIIFRKKGLPFLFSSFHILSIHVHILAKLLPSIQKAYNTKNLKIPLFLKIHIHINTYMEMV